MELLIMINEAFKNGLISETEHDALLQVLEEKTSKKEQHRIDNFLKSHNFTPDKDNPNTGYIDSDEVDPKTGKKKRVRFSLTSYKAFYKGNNTVGDVDKLKKDIKNGTYKGNTEDYSEIQLNRNLLKRKPMESETVFSHEKGHLSQLSNYNNGSNKIFDNYHNFQKEIEKLRVDVDDHEKRVQEYLADQHAIRNSKFGMNGFIKLMNTFISEFNVKQKRLEREYTDLLTGYKSVKTKSATEVIKIIETALKYNRKVDWNSIKNKIKSLEGMNDATKNDIISNIIKASKSQEDLQKYNDKLKNALVYLKNTDKAHVSNRKSEIPSELQDARRSENSAKVRKDVGERYHNHKVNFVLKESEDITSMDELKLSIFEACENDEIDVVTRDSMLEAITEGANIELIKHKLQTRKVYKEKIKEIKKAIKNKEYDKATDAIDDLIKEIEKAIDEINDIDKSNASAIFSMLTASCANVGRTVVALLLAIPTLGISCTVAGLSQLLENISGLVNAHKKHGSLQLSDWNAYFNQVENLYLKYIRVLNALKRDVKKHAVEEKKMEPKKEDIKPEAKKPDKKDESKKDKPEPEKVKPIPTVESVIDAMFEASDQGKLSDKEKSMLIQYIKDKHFH